MLSLSPQESLSLSIGNNNTTELSNLRQGRKYLQFQLSQADYALLEAELVTEIITISPTEILPVPQMIYSILGIYSWRSEMLWIVDLANLAGYPPALESAEVELNDLIVLVIQLQGQALGLVVPKVDNIVPRELAQLKSAAKELFSADILAFLAGYFTDDNNNIVMLIDAEKIFDFFAI